MAIVPVLIGAGFLVGGGLALTHARKRTPLPADLRAQVIAAFQSRDTNTIGRVLEAIKTGAEGRFKGQAEVLQAAIQLGLNASADATKVPADVAALWWAAITSGNPQTMRTTSDGLKVKFNALAQALLDCARILGG